MPYVVRKGRLEFRSNRTNNPHGRRHAGEYGRRLTESGDHVTKGGRRAHSVTPPDFSLVIVPPGPIATGTHAPRIYGPVARAKGPGGAGTPTVSAYMPRKGTAPRAARRAMGRLMRAAHLKSVQA